MITAAKIKAAAITVIMETMVITVITAAKIKAATNKAEMITAMVITVITATTMVKAKVKAQTTIMIVLAVIAIGLAGPTAMQTTESPDSRQLDCIP